MQFLFRVQPQRVQLFYLLYYPLAITYLLYSPSHPLKHNSQFLLIHFQWRGDWSDWGTKCFTDFVAAEEVNSGDRKIVMKSD